MRPQDPQIPATLMVNCLSYSAAVASEGQMNECGWDYASKPICSSWAPFSEWTEIIELEQRMPILLELEIA